jgi:hypothetical protein
LKSKTFDENGIVFTQTIDTTSDLELLAGHFPPALIHSAKAVFLAVEVKENDDIENIGSQISAAAMLASLASFFVMIPREPPDTWQMRALLLIGPVASNSSSAVFSQLHPING